ncbi:MAG: LysM peptidoglycan-binding domain-containing protein [Candidatus Dormibacteria bacterium]
MYVHRTKSPAVESRRPGARARRRARRLLSARRLLLALAVVGLLGLGLAHAVHGSGPGEVVRVRVASGDTLWSIAGQRYPGQDVRARVDQIEVMNSLDGSDLQPGQMLVLPAR